MKKILFLLFVSATSFAQGITIPDTNLRNALFMPGVASDAGGNIINIDADSSGEISIAEASEVFELRLNGRNISSIEGLHHFFNLRKLNVMHNVNMGAVNVAPLFQLETLQIGQSGVTSINLAGLSNLTVLDLFGNNLTVLDVSTLTSLDVLDTFENHNLSFIHFGAISNLKRLLLGNNPITNLDLQNFTQLVQFECVDTNITDLDLSHSPLINYMVITDNIALESMNLRNNTAAMYFMTGNTGLNNVCADAARVSEFQGYFTGIGQTINVNSNCALGIDEVMLPNMVMYPNPADDFVTISAGSAIQVVEIYGLDGKLVALQKAAADSVELNVSHLPAMTYIVKVITEKGTNSLKLIRQ